jgi:Protein of unknown function (DUF2934)
MVRRSRNANTSILVQPTEKAMKATVANAQVDVARKAEHIAQLRAVERHSQISQAAYRLAQQRGFAPGHELDDWLEAEAEIAATERDGSTTTTLI